MAVIGCFGVPFASTGADDALRACRAALRAYDKFLVLNKKRREAAQDELALSAAVVVGDVTSGTIGFEKLEEYTVMGPVVEVAKRLADAAEEYGGTRLLLTDHVMKDVAAHFVTREADVVRLPGVSADPVRVHMLNNLAKTPPTGEEVKAAGVYKEAYALYQAREMEAAIDKCAEAPNDHLCKALRERCLPFVSGAARLEVDWDGAWVPHSLWHARNGASDADADRADSAGHEHRADDVPVSDDAPAADC
mmetsp:Transcript_11746/g.30659  ORF Transcript_11746/g.30659 Transcript_11746/m.30659 type:complete len:250 (+) Transcript_11746:88-837(+)